MPSSVNYNLERCLSRWRPSSWEFLQWTVWHKNLPPPPPSPSPSWVVFFKTLVFTTERLFIKATSLNKAPASHSMLLILCHTQWPTNAIYIWTSNSTNWTSLVDLKNLERNMEATVKYHHFNSNGISRCFLLIRRRGIRKFTSWLKVLFFHIPRNEFKWTLNRINWWTAEQYSSPESELDFRYFLIFSIIKNYFFCIFYKVNNLFLHQSYLKSPVPVKLTW